MGNIQATQQTGKPTAPLKLHYFPLPARAEATRLMLAMKKIPFEDITITFQDWANVKNSSKYPFGQLPILEVGKDVIAESGAIERYAAKIAGFYPVDPLQAAKVDMVACFADEWIPLYQPTMSISDAAEKTEAQLKATEKFKAKLAKLEELASKAGSGFLCGSTLTYADISTFCLLSTIICGLFAGASKDLLKDYPAVAAYHKKVASLPEVAAYYAKATDRDSFKP